MQKLTCVSDLLDELFDVASDNGFAGFYGTREEVEGIAHLLRLSAEKVESHEFAVDTSYIGDNTWIGVLYYAQHNSEQEAMDVVIEWYDRQSS